jgi:transmembrane sensor
MKRIEELLQKFAAETCTKAELLEILQFFHDEEKASILVETSMIKIWSESGTASPASISKEEIYKNVLETVGLTNQEEPALKKHVPILRWLWAAACIFLLVGLTGYLLFREPGIENGRGAKVTGEVMVEPGKSGAFLVSTDGSKVMLDTLDNGVIALQNGTKVILQNGQLVYKDNSNEKIISYNTISTPNGRQFNIQLQDGTLAWLNSGSSIHFPTTFVGKNRIVKVTGEVYFEVSKNSDRPFIVNVDDRHEVVVLGTHFNINAYHNESSINTTLVEGSVQIKKGSSSALLQPGEQAKVTDEIKVKKDINTQQVIAWKNGVFNFEGASIEEVMKQLARWYDLEVIYEKGIPDIRFGGEMRRDLPLSELLKALEMSKVHFRIETGRKLIVLP